MRRTLGLSALSSFAYAYPMLALAQGAGLFNTLAMVNRFMNGLIGIIITMAIIVFFWGLVQYLLNVGEEKHKGLIMMFYGLIALFVMVSVWGIIHLLQATFGVSGQNSIILPAVVPPGAYTR